MAKKASLKRSTAPETTVLTIDPDEFRDSVEEINGYKEKAAEASGRAGKAVSTMVTRFGLDRRAFSWTTQLHKLDGEKRQTTIREFLQHCERMGWLADIDEHDVARPILTHLGVGVPLANRN